MARAGQLARVYTSRDSAVRTLQRWGCHDDTCNHRWNHSSGSSSRAVWKACFSSSLWSPLPLQHVTHQRQGRSNMRRIQPPAWHYSSGATCQPYLYTTLQCLKAAAALSLSPARSLTFGINPLVNICFSPSHCKASPELPRHHGKVSFSAARCAGTASKREAAPGQKKSLFLIGVAGGTASGKTSVCRKIMEQLQAEGNGGKLVSISQDCFYKNLTPEAAADVASYNFDHPDAFDFPELLRALQKLKRGEGVDIPIYDYISNARSHQTERVQGAAVVLLEGILIFHHDAIRDLFDLKIFVDTDADTRLARRIRRDIQDRGRSVAEVLGRYETLVKPSFEQYIFPTKKFADIIVPRGAENAVAINLIVQHIKGLLRKSLRQQK